MRVRVEIAQCSLLPIIAIATYDYARSRLERIQTVLGENGVARPLYLFDVSDNLPDDEVERRSCGKLSRERRHTETGLDQPWES